MKKLIVLLITFTMILISACQPPNSDTINSSGYGSEISKKQYMTHDETQVFEWKCDITPSQIKVYSGSPLEGFFITVDDELYEYNAEIIFSETEKNYRKIDTDLKILYIYYHFQLNELRILTTDFETYAYDKKENTFVNNGNDFGSVLEEFSKRGRIISWGGSVTSSKTCFWFIDEKGDVYRINQTEGREYTQKLMGTISEEEKILFSDTGVIETENGYYCFNSDESKFLLAEEPTAACDNIAFINDLIVMYKDDPTHIYDHNLIYKVKFSYY